MSPASKFVNAKKGGKNSSHGCVSAEPSHRPRRTSRRLAFHERKKKKLTTPVPAVRFDSQMRALAVGGQLQARGGPEATRPVSIRRPSLPIQRAEVVDGSGADAVLRKRLTNVPKSESLESRVPHIDRPILSLFVKPVRDAGIAIPATSRAPRSGVCAGFSARTRADRHGRPGVSWGESW